MVIVGGGAAGLIAALAAHEAGAEVLVLEREHLARGSTALSAGLVPAAGTRWQRDAGVQDSPEIFAADVMAKAHGQPDSAIVELVTRESRRVLEWLADRHGFEFSLITNFPYPGHSAYRMHGLERRAGVQLVDQLRAAAEQAGINLLFDAKATTLFVNSDGRVEGLEFRRPDDSLERVGCAVLVLACNGYGGNRALVREHVPALADALYFGHPGNQGEALLWGQALGAATRHLAGHQGHGSVAHPASIPITWATITAGGIQVNTLGHRFSDEMQGYSEQAAVVLAQPGGVAWSVFDARIADIARQFEDFQQAETAGVILHADDIAGLAATIGVPEAALSAAFAEVAAALAAGGKDRFGRNFAGTQPLAPPYRMVRVTGALFHTQGGLVIDRHAMVLREDGARLPNLFAAGGAACGVSGSEAAGYLSGNGLLCAVALGHVAGVNAALLAQNDTRTAQ